MQNPFALLRHGIAYGSFEDSETRNLVNNLIDSLEEATEELEEESAEKLNIEIYEDSMNELKEHLSELLEVKESKVETDAPERISLGDISDEPDEN